MIRKITIENFKSIQKLELELGRINVLIGANGCGKSNILEAIAFASAGAADKLNNEFLAPRGIRVPDDPRFMRSAFESESVTKDITIAISGYAVDEVGDGTDESEVGIEYDCVLRRDNDLPYAEWVNVGEIPWLLRFFHHMDYQRRSKEADIIERTDEFEKALNYMKSRDEFKKLYDIRRTSKLHLHDFVIYSPENAVLRRFEEEGQLQPMGIKGEGLYKLLRVLSMEEHRERLADIKCRLRLFDWFEDFEIGGHVALGERIIEITDRYLDRDLATFTQRSANEGFLFLLFYFALFVSKDTPSFFGIDNIDAALNPKLCMQLMIELAQLAKQYDKQAIITTHNPSILDGLDLNDDEQRLFVIYRNIHGRTRARRIFKPEPLEGQLPVRLSEAFLRGYLGGLPDNF
jgi:predicted ATPase